jgi:hypothetical protein
MVRFFMFPGEMVSNLAGLPDNSDHRMILRMFTNTLAWGAVAVALALAITI